MLHTKIASRIHGRNKQAKLFRVRALVLVSTVTVLFLGTWFLGWLVSNPLPSNVVRSTIELASAGKSAKAYTLTAGIFRKDYTIDQFTNFLDHYFPKDETTAHIAYEKGENIQNVNVVIRSEKWIRRMTIQTQQEGKKYYISNMWDTNTGRTPASEESPTGL